jgi:hypothetical protein
MEAYVRMVGRHVNDELERMWNAQQSPILRHYFIGGLSKTKELLVKKTGLRAAD